MSDTRRVKEILASNPWRGAAADRLEAASARLDLVQGRKTLSQKARKHA